MSSQTAPSQPEAPSRTELLQGLAELALRLHEQTELPSDETAAARVTLELSGIVQSALVTLNALERLDSTEHDTSGNEPDWEPETWVGIRTAATAAPRLADVCFACTLELNVALRVLERASEYEARLSAVESARRKLYRAIHAVARVAPGSELPRVRESLDQRLDGELESTLSVRRSYAEFRRNLRRAEDESNEAVLTALRYAAGALAALTASPHYRAVRVSDAALLRSQHERLLQWSRSGKPRAAGLQLLEDISTSANLLRAINRRQELRSHDTALIRALLANPSLDRTSWLLSLDRLHGLDDSLDFLTAQLRDSQSTEVVVEILARLAFLV